MAACGCHGRQLPNLPRAREGSSRSADRTLSSRDRMSDTTTFSDKEMVCALCARCWVWLAAAQQRAREERRTRVPAVCPLCRSERGGWPRLGRR